VPPRLGVEKVPSVKTVNKPADSRILMINTAMIQGYGRTLENQSDRLSLQYMADAGYKIAKPRVWKQKIKLCHRFGSYHEAWHCREL